MSAQPEFLQTFSEPTSHPDSAKSLKHWIAPILLTALLHLLFFQFLPGLLSWLSLGARSAPRRTEVTTLNPSDINRLRERIRANEAKRLLLDKNQEQAEPENDRFKDAQTLSNRNQRVEKETRATTRTETVPRPQTGTGGKLANLGVPLPGIGRKQAERKRSKGTTGKPGQAGAEQALIDDSLAEGAENILNTRSSRFYSFYARLQEAIGPLWSSKAQEIPRQIRLPSRDYITRVEVVLDADGQLQDVRVFESAGVEAFDRVVIESWRKVARFPNPPRQLLEKDGFLHMGWTFTFRLESGSGLRVLPPQRGF